MNPEREALSVQVLDVAEQVLDLGAEVLALREVIQERGLVLDDDDVLVRVIRWKSQLAQERGALAARLMAMEAKVEELLAQE